MATSNIFTQFQQNTNPFNIVPQQDANGVSSFTRTPVTTTIQDPVQEAMSSYLTKNNVMQPGYQAQLPGNTVQGSMVPATPTGVSSTNFVAKGGHALPAGDDYTFDKAGNVIDISQVNPDATGIAGAAGTGTTGTNLDAYTQSQINANNAYADKLNATPWADYLSAGASGVGALMGVASYFDNKKMNDKRMDAMDTNIKIAKEEQQHRRDFRNNTKSAFA
jgi:hypothetical protein